MEQFNKEFLFNELFIHMSYEDIVNLCQTNIYYHHMCQDNNLWLFLLRRDFNINNKDQNAFLTYKKYHDALNYFATSFPVITINSLKLIINYIHKRNWSLIIKEEKKQLTKNILTIAHVMFLLSTYHVKMPQLSVIYPQIDELTNDIIDNGCQDFLKLIKNPTLIYYIGHQQLFNYDLDLGSLLLKKLKLMGYDTKDCHQLYKYIINPFKYYYLT